MLSPNLWENGIKVLRTFESYMIEGDFQWGSIGIRVPSVSSDIQLVQFYNLC